MNLIEAFHELKKKTVRWYEDYFTIKGTYTSLLPDAIYLKKLYKQRTGMELNLANPRTFTEKLNWLKIHDRKPEYTIMVDKLLARDYVMEKVGRGGKLSIVPLLGVWDRVEDIDFDKLPKQFVLKCNHDNGVIICRDKSKFDIEKAKDELAWHLHRDYYKKCREWPYKNVRRKIICEKYMTNENGDAPLEYKIYCFNGNSKMIRVYTRHLDSIKSAVYDNDWHYLHVSFNHTQADADIYQRPSSLDEVLRMCGKLSSKIPFLRVDLNLWNKELYFSELTFFPGGGFSPFQPEKWDVIMGDWVNLPDSIV